jgi:hypothetical protein
MNPQMYANAATQDNMAVLQNRGINIIPPDVGEAACGETGIGRMSEPWQIIDIIIKNKQSLINKKVLITVGATREAIDPIRFISNGSSGQMGYAMALIAAQRGARVMVLEGHTSQPRPIPTAHGLAAARQAAAPGLAPAAGAQLKRTGLALSQGLLACLLQAPSQPPAGGFNPHPRQAALAAVYGQAGQQTQHTHRHQQLRQAEA